MKNKLFTALAAISFIFLTASCGFERIDAGSVGLSIPQYGDDKGQPATIVSGTVWYNPFSTTIVEIPSFVQHKEFENLTINAKDGSQFNLSPQLNYRIDRAKVVGTYLKYRKPLNELEEGVIKTIIKETYRVILNSYTTDSIMASRALIERQAFDTLKHKMEREGFIVEQLTSGLYPPQQIVDAINAKNQAVQNAMRIDNEVRSTEAEAKKKVAKAKGDAEAVLTLAKAEAEANRLKQSSLTSLIVQQQFIEKWNGVLPTYGQTPQLFKEITK